MIAYEILDAVLPVTKALDEHHIAYFVGGSVASATYGVARSTMDVDIIAHFNVQVCEPFFESIKSSYFVNVQNIKSSVLTGRSFHLVHLDSAFKVDIYTPQMRPYDRECITRSKNIKVEFKGATHKIKLASAEDVMLRKLEALHGDEQSHQKHLSDIRGILKVQGDALDQDYLKKRAVDLELTDLLSSLLST